MNRYFFSLMAAAIVAAPAAHAQTTAKPMSMDSGMAMHQQKQFDTMMAEHKKQHEAMDHSKMKMPMGSMPGISH